MKFLVRQLLLSATRDKNYPKLLTTSFGVNKKKYISVHKFGFLFLSLLLHSQPVLIFFKKIKIQSKYLYAGI